MAEPISVAERQRRKDRFDFINQTAKAVAADIRQAIGAQTGATVAIKVHESSIRKIEKIYWEAVEGFRKRHKYPENARVNMPKALGFTIYLMIKKRIQIFSIPDPQTSRTWLAECLWHLFDNMMINALSLTTKELASFSKESEMDTRYQVFKRLAKTQTESETEVMLLFLYAESYWSKDKQAAATYTLN